MESWKDIYHPPSGPKGSRIVIPTLESHVLVEETPEFRHFIANPYFFVVDSAGHQLPYINEHHEIYSENIEVTILKMINGEIDYKQQNIELGHFPTLKKNEKNHDYCVLKGEILLHRKDGSYVDIAALKPTKREMCSIRGGEVSMIFQEPMSSFSPVHTIGNQISEAIITHRKVTKQEAREIAIDILDQVGISNAAHRFNQFSFELSGGMRQRAMIAVALSSDPSLLIADEPTTALDVTIQAQVLELKEQHGMSIIFITHNLGVIAQIADEIAVMYLGQIIEQGPRHQIFKNPKHPYTLNLLNAIPHIGKEKNQRLTAIEGLVPSPLERPTGCSFHTRCRRKIAGRCDLDTPQVTTIGKNHVVTCFLYE